MAESVSSPDPEVILQGNSRDAELGAGDQAYEGDTDEYEPANDNQDQINDKDELAPGHVEIGDVSRNRVRRGILHAPHFSNERRRHNRDENTYDSDSEYDRYPTPVPLQNYQVPVKPESFHGKDDWEEYISHFENCAELGRWSHRTKLLYLSASLRGPARTYYMSLPPSEKETYKALVSSLSQRFGSTKHQNRWLSRLEMRKRLPGESIATVGDDIRQMAQKAYRNLDIKAQEALALNQLYKIVSIEMKCRCIDKNCKTVAEAVEVIERYESIVGETNDKKKGAVRALETRSGNQGNQNSGKEGLQSETSLIQELMTRIEKLEKTNTQGQDYRDTDWRSETNRRLAMEMEMLFCTSILFLNTLR